MEKLENKINIRRLFGICLCVFGVSTIATIILGYWGFCVPPKGVIDASVLQFSTILMGGNSLFDAFVCGFLAIINGKSAKFKTPHGEVQVGGELDEK